MPVSLRIVLALMASLASGSGLAAGEADNLHDRAIALYREGRYAEGAGLAQKALALREQLLGLNHPDVAKDLDTLAALYMAQNKNAEAEPLFRRSSSILEAALGPNHPDVATSLCNFGRWFEFEGRAEEAESQYQRCLSIREKALGPEHLEVAEALDKLGLLYARNFGQYDDEYGDDPEALLKQSLAIREKTLGLNHIDVAKSLDHLALLYQAQRRFSEAEPLLRRTLAIREQALGRDHNDVVETRSRLALLYSALGRFDDAKRLREEKSALAEDNIEPQTSPKAGLAWLGLRVEAMDSGTAQSLGWNSPRGAIVKELLEKSPAAGTALRVGDMIMALDDHLIVNADDLTNTVATYRPNSRVKLQVFRFGAWFDVPVTLGTSPVPLRQVVFERASAQDKRVFYFLGRDESV